jgi:predicted CDP-diglyceride synthetase/phosphatidate cytidylyltransferase
MKSLPLIIVAVFVAVLIHSYGLPQFAALDALPVRGFLLGALVVFFLVLVASTIFDLKTYRNK